MHRRGSDYLITSEGFLVICSDTSKADEEHAGVGFLVAPWMRKYVISFIRENSRLASIKLRVEDGKINRIESYVPHNGPTYSYLDRQSFFNDLGDFEN